MRKGTVVPTVAHPTLPNGEALCAPSVAERRVLSPSLVCQGQRWHMAFYRCPIWYYWYPCEPVLYHYY